MSVIEVDFEASPAALVLDTPTNLVTETTPGVYQLFLDSNALAAGDILVVRSKIKVTSGGTARTLEQKVLGGITSDKAWCTDPVMVAHEVIYELEQTDGTGRSIPWSVVRG